MWTLTVGKVIWWKACAAEMYAYKDICGSFQAVEIHLPGSNGRLSLSGSNIWVGFSPRYGTKLKHTLALVKDLFYAVTRWETLCPPTALELHYKLNTPIIFWAFTAVINCVYVWGQGDK